MKQLLWSLVALAAMLLGTMATRALAQEGGADTCPDEKATHVEGETVEGGPIYLCIGLYHFGGLTLSVQGPKCPGARFVYPAHDVCSGETSKGSRCEERGKLEVIRENCKCAFLSLFGIQLPAIVCRCQTAGPAGHVSDAVTLPCPRERR